MHKMPYKHIAAHLQKTELACRLHYHQLSFGTKRRKRTCSVTSARSPDQASFRPNVTQQLALPSISPPDTPERLDTLSGLVSQSPLTHVPILPKPVKTPQKVVQHSNALRLITQDIDWAEEQSRISPERLNRIYEAHRSHFWSMVARDYGDNVSPALLEDTWRRTVAPAVPTNLPPTPNGSPQFTKAPTSALSSAFSTPASAFSTPVELRAGSGFSPVNNPNILRSATSTSSVSVTSARSAFAISSLLTENKEVRNPCPEKKSGDCEMT